MCFLTYYAHDFKGGFFFKGDDDLILMVVDSFYSRGLFAVTTLISRDDRRGASLHGGRGRGRVGVVKHIFHARIL